MSNNDPKVIFTPSGKKGHFPVGTPVLQAARALGVDLDSVCGMRGICSKCQITPSFGDFPKHGISVTKDALTEWNSVESRYHKIRGLKEGRRLGCQAKINSDVLIDVPEESQVHKQVIRKRVEARDIILNPTIKKYYIEVEEPDMHQPTGDFERLKLAFQEQWNINNIAVDLTILKNLQKPLRKGEWKVTVALHNQEGSTKNKIIHIWPGFYDGPIYGVAVDLGSTTIAANLCDLETGLVVSSAGAMNPQIRFGEDLMSRVSYSMMNPGGDEEMTTAVRDGLNSLFDQVSSEANISKDLIMDSVFVCNPVMHHLLLGVDPFELGQAPFALTTSQSLNLSAKDLDLNLNKLAQSYILPCIAGHVGADAAAVALSEAPNLSDDLVLIVDVGTNAEIMLGSKTLGVLACSSPTGPAFEGAQISSGQRAAPGAIERVQIDPNTKEPRFRVIGSNIWSDEEGFFESISESGITGICGSGIIEMVAEMRIAGIVDGPGLIGSPEQTGSARCFLDGRTHSYLVWDGSKDGGPIITVTNKDIREIQMAKAALYSGARLLMDKLNVDVVERIVLAGAFGAHISPKHAMVLGMIPDCEIKKVTSAGNAAGTGARIALLNKKSRNEIETVVSNIEKIETAIEPRFQEHFVNASAIPNSSDPFPILASLVTLPDVNFNKNNDNTSRENKGRRRRKV
jgi:uncharacterized 2Fe-2S/4Fe-4S cluster protein (DUF4445 family)